MKHTPEIMPPGIHHEGATMGLFSRKTPGGGQGSERTGKKPRSGEMPSRRPPAVPESLPRPEGVAEEVLPRTPAPAAPPSSGPRPSSPLISALTKNDLPGMLAEAMRLGASDLHLTRNMPPVVRQHGRLTPLESPVLSAAECEQLVYSILSEEQRARFDKDWELDLSVDMSRIGRFRANIHRQRGTVEAAFRMVNDQVRTLKELGLPAVAEETARRNSGLIMVTGPTGSGKTTTLAAMVDQLNHERSCVIITVEDPIEYIHRNRKAIIKQREVTSDTRSFPRALRHVLRQDPDVIVIGEMRDLETIETALIAAETGHLVLSTLHTPDAVQTIDRIIDVFPPHQQLQVRTQLASSLQAIIAQQLVPVVGGKGRVAACEVLLASHGVRKQIRTGKSEQLMTIIQTSFDQGMISMDKSLKTLYQQGIITFDEAISRFKFPESFEQI